MEYKVYLSKNVINVEVNGRRYFANYNQIIANEVRSLKYNDGHIRSTTERKEVKEIVKIMKGHIVSVLQAAGSGGSVSDVLETTIDR